MGDKLDEVKAKMMRETAKQLGRSGIALVNSYIEMYEAEVAENPEGLDQYEIDGRVAILHTIRDLLSAIEKNLDGLVSLVQNPKRK